MKSRASLVTNLLHLAARLRDPLRLAVALRAHDPDAGASATFTAYGLRDLLDHVDWRLDGELPERFAAYAQDLAALHPEPLWTLRRDQFRRLLVLVERPRPVGLRRSADAGTRDRQFVGLLVECANRGCTLSDLRNLSDAETGLPRAGLVRPRDLGDQDLPAALAPWRDALRELDAGDYIDLLEPDDRDLHPDTLRAATLRDLAALGRASRPSPERRLEASLADLAERDDESGQITGAVGSGRMEA